ncbi:MAG: hypothetical protein EU530_10640 [Promethearchaeota archaeon]|nr:MAG: hypothetical protein EU530_10640 [Candidatus Lokiarchaeota archaeon]
MDKIRKYLDMEGHTFLVREDRFIIPWKIGDLNFHITINFRDSSSKWIVVDALICSFDEIPNAVEKELYHSLLLANHNLPEINYQLDVEGNVLCSVDMDKEIVNYENFFSEFNAIPYGIKYFLEKIAPPLKISVSGRE